MYGINFFTLTVDTKKLPLSVSSADEMNETERTEEASSIDLCH